MWAEWAVFLARLYCVPPGHPHTEREHELPFLSFCGRPYLSIVSDGPFTAVPQDKSDSWDNYGTKTKSEDPLVSELEVFSAS